MAQTVPLSPVPRRLTVADVFLIVILLTSGVLFIPLAASSAPVVAENYRDNRIVAEYPLSTPARFVVRGENGDVALRIEGNAIAVVSSRCPRQICRHAGAISKPFEQSVCVPNHVLIEIRSGTKRDLDAVAR